MVMIIGLLYKFHLIAYGIIMKSLKSTRQLGANFYRQAYGWTSYDYRKLRFENYLSYRFKMIFKANDNSLIEI